MKYFLLLLSLVIFSSTIAFAEISYTKPTEFEFKVYKYVEDRIWDLPAGKEPEIELYKKAASKFGVTFGEVKAVIVKFMWYELQIQRVNPNFPISGLANMSWVEAKQWVDKIGLPKKIG